MPKCEGGETCDQEAEFCVTGDESGGDVCFNHLGAFIRDELAESRVVSIGLIARRHPKPIKGIINATTFFRRK